MRSSSEIACTISYSIYHPQTAKKGSEAKESKARLSPTFITISASEPPSSKATSSSIPTLPSIPEQEEETDVCPPGLQTTITDTSAPAPAAADDEDDDKMDIDAEWPSSFDCSLLTRQEVEYDDDAMDVDVVDLWCNESPMVEDIEMTDVTS